MKRTSKQRRAERQAIERAILRTLRSVWVPNDTVVGLASGVQARLLGLEMARRAVTS